MATEVNITVESNTEVNVEVPETSSGLSPDFSADQTEIEEGDSITFTADDQSVKSYWEIEDNSGYNHKDGDSVSHQYNNAGIYGAILTQTDISKGVCGVKKKSGLITVNEATISLPTDQLKAAYFFEESAGSAAKDEIGSLDLTDNNTVQRATGRVNQGALFEKANNEEFTHPDDPVFDFNSSFTIIFWCYFTSGGNKGTLIEKNNEYLLFYSGGIRWYVHDDQGNTITLIPGIDEADDTWFLLTVGYDSANSEIFMKKNLNSKQTKTFNNNLASTTNDFKVVEGSTDCKMDILGIYHKALTSSEIEQYYNNGNGVQ